MNAVIVLPNAACAGRKLAFGTVYATSDAVLNPRCCRSCAVIAVIAIGVCCRLSSRYRAVTTTSCKPADSSDLC